MKKPPAIIAFVILSLILFAESAVSSAQSEYDLGMTAYNSGSYKKAAGHFWQSINDGNTSAHAWLYLAHSHAASGNKVAAIKTYQQIVTRFKNTDAAKLAQQAIQKLSTASDATATSTNTQSSGTVGAVSTERGLPDLARVFYRADDDDIMVSVRINDRPIEMELDTGAPGIVLSKKDILALGLIPPSGKADGTSGGASNSDEIEYWRMPATVQVGSIRRENIKLKVMDQMHTHPLLGQDFFKDFDYTIDHHAKCIEFRKKGTAHAPTSTAYSVPFEFREDGSRIVVEVEINGKKAPVMFDTGNGSAGISFADKKQMQKFALTLPADARLSRSTGVTGSGSCYRFKVNRIKLGPIEKHDVNAEMDMDVEDDEDLPLIGQEVWRGWQYTIDMKNRKIDFLRR